MLAMHVDTSKQINDSLIIEKLNESIQNLELSLPKFKNIKNKKIVVIELIVSGNDLIEFTVAIQTVP